VENKIAEGEQHTVRNKPKENLQIMWHKVRLLQMFEREKQPKLKTNSKLIKFQEEINGVIEELLEEKKQTYRYKQSDIRRSQNYDTNIELVR
jgi:RecB family endonuclease NucS